MKTRQWLLESRPTAEITRDNFTMVERDIGEPDMATHPGAALLRKVLPPHAA